MNTVLVIRMSVLLAALAAAGALLAGCGSQESTITGLQRPEPLDVSGVTVTEVTGGAEQGDFRFLADPGEVLLVYFGYTSCPDVCPSTLADLRTARQQLGPDGERLDLAMVTVDPDRDTPELLDRYVGSFAERYHALRPVDAAELEAAEDAFLASSTVTTTDEGRVEVSHTGTVYAVDSSGRVLVEWAFGTPWRAIADDLRVLLEPQ